MFGLAGRSETQERLAMLILAIEELFSATWVFNPSRTNGLGTERLTHALARTDKMLRLRVLRETELIPVDSIEDYGR